MPRQPCTESENASRLAICRAILSLKQTAAARAPDGKSKGDDSPASPKSTARQEREETNRQAGGARTSLNEEITSGLGRPVPVPSSTGAPAGACDAANLSDGLLKSEKRALPDDLKFKLLDRLSAASVAGAVSAVKARFGFRSPVWDVSQSPNNGTLGEVARRVVDDARGLYGDTRVVIINDTIGISMEDEGERTLRAQLVEATTEEATNAYKVGFCLNFIFVNLLL